jgi:NitT/TauT family transport system substrate-binding protein
MRLTILEPFRSPFYAPVYAAVHAGHFGAEGLDARVETAGHGRNPRGLLPDGGLEVGCSGIVRAFALAERGEPYPVQFAEVCCRSGFFLVAREASLRLADLPGRTVATYPGAPTPFLFLMAALRASGIDPGRVRIRRDLEPDAALAAFRDCRVDVLDQPQPLVERLVASGEGHLLLSIGEATGAVPFTSLNVPRETLDRAGEPLVQVTRALARAQRFVAGARTDDLAGVVAPALPGLPRPQLAAALDRYRRQGTWPPDPRLGPAGYARIGAILRDGGLVARIPPYEALVDSRIAAEAVRCL